MLSYRMSRTWFENKWLFVAALLYLIPALIAGWQSTLCTAKAMDDFDQSLAQDSLINTVPQLIKKFDDQHHIIGPLLSPMVRESLSLSSEAHSEFVLEQKIPTLRAACQKNIHQAYWWSWMLISLSLLYGFAIVGMERAAPTPALIVAATNIALIFFLMGIFAPAMVIWTRPSIPMLGQTFQFVLQHQVRSISSVIKELFTSGHWIIASLIALFSIVTPLLKFALTYTAVLTSSLQRRIRIGTMLHAIGKWSMADVFVAGVLLALFSLKSQVATKTMPSLGLFYFIGYCLLSLATSSCLVHGAMERKNSPRLELPSLVRLLALILATIAILAALTAWRGSLPLPS